MLVLTRRKGESILIGDDIEIRLLGLNKVDARIGIEAPKHLAIDRQEVREKRASGDAHGPKPRSSGRARDTDAEEC